MSGLLLHMTIMHAKRFRSSCNSTIWPALETVIFFPMVFHVWNFLFFTGDQKLIFPGLIRSFTNDWNSCWPMPFCSKRSFVTLLGITTFVTTLKRWLLCSMKGFVKFSIVVTNCSMFFSSWEITEADKVWWWVPSFAKVVPAMAISLASSARWASSGAMRNNSVREFAFSAIPTSPSETFIKGFIYPRTSSAPKYEMAHPGSC